MTKKELLKQIEDLANSNEANVSGKQTEKVFNAVLECIRKLTVSEGEVPISDFGKSHLSLQRLLKKWLNNLIQFWTKKREAKTSLFFCAWTA